jgi:hypothetical protein
LLRRTPLRRALAVACLSLVVACAGAGRAGADGDPASDVLASQSAFIPGDAGIAPGRRDQLAALAQEAGHSPDPIRLAIIAGPADLGSVTELWRMPQSYARFLAQELSLVYRGTVLVVMPQGFGVAVAGHPPAAKGSRLTTLANGAPHGSLGNAAEIAVLALARADGHPLRLPAAVAGPAPGSALGSVDAGSWLALTAGALLVGLAWAASLRARPPAPLRRSS